MRLAEEKSRRGKGCQLSHPSERKTDIEASERRGGGRPSSLQASQGQPAAAAAREGTYLRILSSACSASCSLISSQALNAPTSPVGRGRESLMSLVEWIVSRRRFRSAAAGGAEWSVVEDECRNADGRKCESSGSFMRDELGRVEDR